MDHSDKPVRITIPEVEPYEAPAPEPEEIPVAPVENPELVPDEPIPV